MSFKTNFAGSDVLKDVPAPGSYELEKSIVPPSSSTASAFRSKANCLTMSRSSQQVKAQVSDESFEVDANCEVINFLLMRLQKEASRNLRDSLQRGVSNDDYNHSWYIRKISAIWPSSLNNRWCQLRDTLFFFCSFAGITLVQFKIIIFIVPMWISFLKTHCIVFWDYIRSICNYR